MKEVIAGIALCACFGTEGMLVPYGSDTSIVPTRREERVSEDLSRTGVMDIAANSEEGAHDLASAVNLRQVRNPLQLDDGMVQVSVRDFIRSDNGVTAVTAWYTRQYPLQKTLLRYEHDFAAGFSRPVQELFATVTDVEHADRSGKIIVEEEFLDDSIRIPHLRRSTGAYEMDDEHLQAKPFTEIVITTERGDETIDAAKVRQDDAFVAYIRTETRVQENILGEPEPIDGDSEFNYQRKETLEEWKRPDGTIFCKRTEGVQKVAKPKQSAPIQPAPQVVVNQPAPSGGGVSNEFERFGHAAGNCIVV